MTDVFSEISIIDMSAEGHGVGVLPDGKRVFVQGGVWVGDTVTLRVFESKKKYCLAELVQLEQQSKLRSKPLCSLHGHSNSSCGGCDWMHGSYESQLAMKESIVRFALRANRLETNLHKMRPSSKAYGYRSRARLHFDGDKLGFYSSGSEQIVDVEACPVLSGAASEQLEAARSHILGSGGVAGAGKQQVDDQRKVQQKMKPTEVFVDDIKQLSGDDFLRPQGFRQANQDQNTFLQQEILEACSQGSTKQVLELFAGTGNFSGHIAGQVGSDKLSCIDVKACGAGFKKNHPDIRYQPIDLYRFPKKLSKLRPIKVWDTLVLDPPRTGWSELGWLCTQATSLRKIIYVSCNPNSFAKDVKPLVSNGWKLSSVKPVDMMPQTSQVELIAFLERAL
jgi:23S rRNA (uracil1939-C5)-methyltransferase